MNPKFKSLRTIAIQAFLILIITIGLLEAIMFLSFRFPAMSPIPGSILQQMHVLFVRNTIQLMPECARHDDELAYTLRPGQCTFSNTEFRNKYYINSLGLRDDEESLHRPETVVLGDSVAMGWGVEQSDAFPQVYERLTGSRTLNAGVSSYGTVRELLLLERIDRSALSHLIIQYHENDLPENEQFVNGNWRTLTQEEYENAVRANAQMQRYFPGKHSLNVVVRIRNALRNRGRDPGLQVLPTDRDSEADTFLRVLEMSPVDLAAFHITVLALDSAFISAARRLASDSESPLVRALRFVDAEPIAKIPDAFYVLDDHPTAIGHNAMAKLLATVED